MKKRVSVQELKKYIHENRIRNVTYFAENQRGWGWPVDPCKFGLHFQKIAVFENPNTVCLQSGRSKVCFGMVRCAEIDTESTVLGTILTLFCGDPAGKRRRSYRLIAET